MGANKTLTIDNDLRIITIPPSVTLLGVENENNVKRLHFRMPRMYRDIDLADFTPRINYMNAANEGDVYVPKDVKITDSDITFSWRVGRFALKYRGKVKFIVCLREKDVPVETAREFNTTPASLPTLRGLPTNNAAVEDHPEILEQILLQLSEVESYAKKNRELIEQIGTGPTGPQGSVQSVNGKTGVVNLSADDVGTDPAGTAGSAVSAHNTATDAHNDLRLLIEALTSRLNTLADSDDTTLDQLSELVDYIKSNRELIEQITTGKVSVSDIVDNLTTNATGKPLSAAQGVVLKSLIDGVTASLANYQPKGNYLTEAPVQSVNGKTGAVKLSATDVGARPNTWTPTAADIQSALGYKPASQSATITITGKDADGNTHTFTVVGWERADEPT